MGICPRCKHKLDSLKEDRVQRSFYTMDRTAHYCLDDLGDVISSRYYCPNCDKQFTFDDERQAIEFLNGRLKVEK